VGFRFFAIPGHKLVAAPAPQSLDDLLEPTLPPLHEAVEYALTGAEFRDMRARDRLRTLLASDKPPPHGAPSKGYGPSAVFAQPPGDLPALLRMADQLDMLAGQDDGERALVWKCQECQTRYAVPVALVRNVAIRCERCGTTVELHLNKTIGEDSLLDPFHGSVNQARRELAVFFREAMARGWPVLVASNQ
jgi:hypothetical protein